MSNYLYNGFKNLETNLMAIILDADVEYWREEVRILRSNGLNTTTELNQELETRFNNRAEAFKRVNNLTSKVDLLVALSYELNLHEPPPETPPTWLRELLMIHCLQQNIDWRQLTLHLIPEDDEIDD